MLQMLKTASTLGHALNYSGDACRGKGNGLRDVTGADSTADALDDDDLAVETLILLQRRRSASS